MKEKGNQLFRDKFVLVMLVLGLLTIVAAAGVVRIQKGRENIEKSPYLEIEDPDHVIAGDSNAGAESGGDTLAGELAASKDETRNVENTGDGRNAALAENEAGTGTDPAAAAPGISEDTGLADAAGGAGAASDRSMAEAGAAVTESLVLDFADTDKLAWPVNGNIVLGYSMDTTTYFPTLDQYKVNPANVIQSEVSTPVSAPADARIVSVGTNEEIGNYVDLDFGNGYTAVCGQLKEIPVVENEYVHRGDLGRNECVLRILKRRRAGGCAGFSGVSGMDHPGQCHTCAHESIRLWMRREETVCGNKIKRSFVEELSGRNF